MIVKRSALANDGKTAESVDNLNLRIVGAASLAISTLKVADVPSALALKPFIVMLWGGSKAALVTSFRPSPLILSSTLEPCDLELGVIEDNKPPLVTPTIFTA